MWIMSKVDRSALPVDFQRIGLVGKGVDWRAEVSKRFEVFVPLVRLSWRRLAWPLERQSMAWALVVVSLYRSLPRADE